MQTDLFAALVVHPTLTLPNKSCRVLCSRQPTQGLRWTTSSSMCRTSRARGRASQHPTTTKTLERQSRYRLYWLVVKLVLLLCYVHLLLDREPSTWQPSKQLTTPAATVQSVPASRNLPQRLGHREAMKASPRERGARVHMYCTCTALHCAEPSLYCTVPAGTLLRCTVS